MRTIGISLVTMLLAGVPLSAQVRADPGVTIGNRIAVRVNVTLSDDETPYVPVRGLALTFTRAGSDTIGGRTDEAGVVTVLLLPGDYVITAPRPYAWKGTSYTWRVPVTVRSDMRAVELSRANARVDGSPSVTAGGDKGSALQSAGEVGTSGSRSGRASEGAVPWLSMEVGGEGGLTRLGTGTGSDAGYGGSGSFVGGVGPVALAVGYRYTTIRYGGGVDPGSLRNGTVELRYHFRPGSAPVRPYIGGVGGVGRWYGPETLTEDHRTLRMLGGTVGVQFGLATSVRLHVSATAAGTNVRTSSQTTKNGLFAAANVGLTFDIFSPAR